MSDNFNNFNNPENPQDNFKDNTEETVSQHKNVIKPKKNKSGKIVLIVVLAVIAFLFVAQLIAIAVGSFSNKPKKGHTVPRTTGKYVAELVIKGTIQEENDDYNQKWLLQTIQELKNDSNNLGILLYIDSPGGTVYEADEAYLALMDYRREKPVWAYFSHMAASGGYYIGCSAEKIAANRNSLTGSIGVISGKSVDLTQLMQKYGIKMTTITAGKNKNMLNINSPLTDEQKLIMQALADECYDQFVQIVSDSRGLSTEEVKSLADGRIYSASQALENKLIDSICAYDEYKEEYKVFLRNDKVSFKEFKYTHEPKFYEKFGFVKSNQKNLTSEEALVEKLVNSNLSFPAFIYQY